MHMSSYRTRESERARQRESERKCVRERERGREGGRESLIEMESKDDHKTQLSQRRKTRREKTGKEWSAAASILHIWRACSARTHTNTRTYSMNDMVKPEDPGLLVGDHRAVRDGRDAQHLCRGCTLR